MTLTDYFGDNDPPISLVIDPPVSLECDPVFQSKNDDVKMIILLKISEINLCQFKIIPSLKQLPVLGYD